MVIWPPQDNPEHQWSHSGCSSPLCDKEGSTQVTYKPNFPPQTESQSRSQLHMGSQAGNICTYTSQTAPGSQTHTSAWCLSLVQLWRDLWLNVQAPFPAPGGHGDRQWDVPEGWTQGQLWGGQGQQCPGQFVCLFVCLVSLLSWEPRGAL